MTYNSMTGEEFDVRDHAKKVDLLLDDYRQYKNERVPISFACDEALWLKIAGYSFMDFYTKPKVHLETQLKGREWFLRNVIGDMSPELPDQWNISTQYWMEEADYFGCDIVLQENDYAWGKPLKMEKENLIKYIREIDPEENICKSNAFKLYEGLKNEAEGKTYLERSIKIIPPGTQTHGFLQKRRKSGD